MSFAALPDQDIRLGQVHTLTVGGNGSDKVLVGQHSALGLASGATGVTQ